MFFGRTGLSYKNELPPALAGGLVNTEITGLSQSYEKKLTSELLELNGAKAIRMIDNLFKFGLSHRTMFNLGTGK